MPRLSVFHNDYGPHGFEALSININEGMDTVKAWARQNTNVYLRDPNTVWPVYRQSGGLPTNYVIDTAGVIRYWAEGYNENAVRQVIEQYLPDPIQHDVGVVRLMAPTGSTDSGTTIVPACSLRNYRSHAETYPVRMRIGTSYDTTVTVTSHQPGQTVYVEFPQWTASERGQSAVACTTELADDDIGSNNAAKSTITVNVDDIAVSAILAPADTAELGRDVVPAVEVKNLGTLSDMARVRFYISDFYYDTVRVALQPGKTDTAVLDIWTPALLGAFPVRCTCATIRIDQVTSNNDLSQSVFVQPAGIEEQPAGNARFVLFGSSRNPVTTGATVRYSLGAASHVDLRVFSANGTLVRTLRSGVESPGRHDATWDGHDDSGHRVGRGTYFCRLTAGDFRASRQIVLVE